MVKLLVLAILIIGISTPSCYGTGRPPRLISKEKTVGPYLSYIVSSRHISNAAVIVATDAFGMPESFKAPLLRQFADKIASEGYFVVVPDFFNGDPYIENANLTTWLQKHDPVDAAKGAKTIIKILQKKGFSSIGAVGFCWGGKVGVELAKGTSLKTVVIAHPGLVTVDDIKEVRTPIAILAAELDTITPPPLVRQFIAVLNSKPKLKSFVHIYPGVPHGWTIRYNVSDPQAVANAEKAQSVILAWLGKFLHPHKKYNK